MNQTLQQTEDPDNDLLVVARWIPGGDIDGLLKLILDSIEEPGM